MSQPAQGNPARTDVQEPLESAPRAVHRVEVAHKPGMADPRAEGVLREAIAMRLPASACRFASVYLIEAPFGASDLKRIATLLLASPILDDWIIGAAPARSGWSTVEIHPLPGVMDPAAQTVRQAIREITGLASIDVTTGRRYDLDGVTSAQADSLARRVLANPVIHAIHATPFHPASLPKGTRGSVGLRHVPIRDMTTSALEKLSREAHLFLSLDEMRAIQSEYKRLNREPTDIELETLAQTWSEHCVHKTLKSRIRYRGAPDDIIEFRGRPGHAVQPDGSIVIDNLLKSTVAAATHELIAEGLDWTLSVFKDNSGVIAFDDAHAVCVKVETHNHPSAIEPYGGAATGAGGCIRDVIGTGLGAKPIANTDVFCVAYPDHWKEKDAATPVPDLPTGCLHPRRTLIDVVAGVRDYGNRMGIPTVNGAVWFDDRHIGNPLVFCGCVGVMPRDRVKGAARAGDLIVALGGRTGRDGVHGATFSSAELTDAHADEFSHAVQIGNAIEEKRVLDAILRARDVEGGPLYNGITDCGAGGFSSAVGEMGATLGAEVHLDRAPLKYDGLTYTEIWISEAQERMVLAVAPSKLAALRQICAEESVEVCELGVFGTPGAELLLKFEGAEVGRMSMEFLHDGIPTPVREAEWGGEAKKRQSDGATKGQIETIQVSDLLLALLSHPNIASKRWIVRQYDHEVQSATVIKPLVGPLGAGPGDAAVVQPVPGTARGLAIGCGLATGIGDPALPGGVGDPYLMALAAVDECVRNLVCVGADPDRIAILDNFCWPSCAKAENLGSLVRAAEGCYDAAKAYRTPFVSGKDSLNNQFTTDDGRTIEIPPTLLISGIGIVPDVARCVTSDAKRAGNVLWIVGYTVDDIGGSHLQRLTGAESPVPRTHLEYGPKTARAVATAIRAGVVAAAHDCSDGGLLVAVAEMLIGAAGESPKGPMLGATIDVGEIGYSIDFDRDVGDVTVHRVNALCFSETPSRYILEVAPEHGEAFLRTMAGISVSELGRLDPSGILHEVTSGISLPVAELKAAWLAPLDW